MGKHGQILLVAALAVTLCACGGESSVAEERSAELPAFFSMPIESCPGVTFPCTLADGLVAEELMAYDGPFWEDGSGAPVSGVAALMLSNTGTRMIEFGVVTMEQEGKLLHFFVYDFPPGSRCLVAECQQQPFFQGGIEACRAGILRWSYQEMSREEVNYVGTDERLTVVNRTSRMQNIVVRYKRYDKEGDYYLGGMAFSAHFLGVKPQDPKTLAPEHYHAGMAKVVSVTVGE